MRCRTSSRTALVHFAAALAAVACLAGVAAAGEELPILDVGAGVVKTYGGTLSDWAYDILLLADGGTLVVGQSESPGFAARSVPGRAHAMRTNAQGEILWERDYFGGKDGMFYCPIQAGADEYVILGQVIASYQRDEDDIALVKIDGQGNVIWSHTYGGRGMDVGKMVRQTTDGGFIIAADRSDEFPSVAAGEELYRSKAALIRTDSEGNEMWTKLYGTYILYMNWGVAETPDGGYVFAGWEAKTHDDRDVIVIKTDDLGTLEWSRTWDLDPGERDGAFDLILTRDGDVVVCGIQSMNAGPRRGVLLKVDLAGKEVWVKQYGGDDELCEFWDVMEDADGGYVMSGGYLPENPGWQGGSARRGLIQKTDRNGNVIWHYAVSGSAYSSLMFSSAVVLPQGGYVLVGSATPNGKGYPDILWFRLDREPI